MEKRLIELHVENFRSLKKVTLPLGPLNVLVGANGVGKTNVLKVFDFLSDVIRTDLEPALQARGGFDEVIFWGGERPPSSMKIRLKAAWTTHASRNAPDEYELMVTRRGRSLSRKETFQFKRTQGRGRRITITGEQATVIDQNRQESQETLFGIRRLSSGLSTLPRLSDNEGGTEVSTVAEQLASLRVFDVSVSHARGPNVVRQVLLDYSQGLPGSMLNNDASNLAFFLLFLKHENLDAFEQLQRDAAEVLPQLEGIGFEFPSGAAREVIVVLHERGLRRPTPLADASYGTIRLLGLLALLHDPKPPALTCIEEIDHGLHPQALSLLVERLREASERTQFLIATHSPALADRLRPEELIVCRREDDGSSSIPALSTRQINDIVEASEGEPLGELWFAGALGGDL